MVDEVEQPVVRPVQILEGENERMARGERLEEAPPGGERLAAPVAADLLAAQADERAQVALDPGRLSGVFDRCLDGGAELGFGILGGVRRQDLRPALDHFPKRPEGHALAVRQAPAHLPDQLVGIGGGLAPELVEKPALPDSGLTHEGDELDGALLLRPGERASEGLELLRAAHERPAAALERFRVRLLLGRDRFPDRKRLRLPLRLHRLRLPVFDRVLRRRMRRPVHKDPVHRRRRLEPRRPVEDVAGGHPLPLARTRPQRDNGLPRRHRDPHVQVQPRIGRIALRDRFSDRKRRPHATLRVVLVRRRRAEERDHGIADELLHRSPEALQLRAQTRVVRSEELPHVLRIELPRPPREVDQIGEQDRDDLALLRLRLPRPARRAEVEPRRDHGPAHRTRGAQLPPAPPAEAGLIWILEPARRAGHGASWSRLTLPRPA